MKKNDTKIPGKTALFVFLPFIFLSFLSGLSWLGLVLLTAAVLFVLVKWLGRQLFKHTRGRNASYLAYFFITILAAIFIRLFVVEIFMVPSNSMEETIHPGDVILVNKLAMGPVMPRSPMEIPLVNLVCYAFNRDIPPDSLWWDYKKLSGFSTIQSGDVVVFHHHHPRRRGKIFVKRCGGLPGDTLQIINSVVTVNDKQPLERETTKKQYLVFAADKAQAKQILQKRSIHYHTRGDTLFCKLTVIQAKNLRQQAGIDSLVCKSIRYFNKGNMFPHTKNINWTMDNFGPMVIPEKGMRIKLNGHNYDIYKKAVNLLEGTALSKAGDGFLVDGIPAGWYTFQNDYYFMIGDYRTVSFDSRYWGFLPHERIIGKVSLVLFSVKNKNWNWNRLLKRIQ